VAKDFLARLRAGAAPAPLPPPGSLEWFTASDEPHAELIPQTYKHRTLKRDLRGVLRDEVPEHEPAVGQPVDGRDYQI
jgi:hypothetical protein